jgi:hypothetical protein
LGRGSEIRYRSSFYRKLVEEMDNYIPEPLKSHRW